MYFGTFGWKIVKPQISNLKLCDKIMFYVVYIILKHTLACIIMKKIK